MSLDAGHPSQGFTVATIYEAADSAHASLPLVAELVDFGFGVEHLHRLKCAVNEAGDAIEET
jgi:hypothetical protein